MWGSTPNNARPHASMFHGGLTIACLTALLHGVGDAEPVLGSRPVVQPGGVDPGGGLGDGDLQRRGVALALVGRERDGPIR
ncbi:hypothetical protein [Lentzea nigeriaca]|uniref:hypothetical protein n=1 Tax=Lentzea nigeriaca TaxID=1128665 RepID=UPI00195DF178|nr:hypothetical protein [Lentzea nigeriaca]MBM7862864.1 hypothetical protein [Lentzea nigeriaca]